MHDKTVDTARYFNVLCLLHIMVRINLRAHTIKATFLKIFMQHIVDIMTYTVIHYWKVTKCLQSAVAAHYAAHK